MNKEQFIAQFERQNNVPLYDFATVKFNVNPSRKEGVVVKYNKSKDKETSGKVMEFASLKDLQDSEDFQQIIDDINANKVFEINYWVTAFSDTQNANFSRPKPGKLKTIASKYSKESSPLLDDHKGTQENRKGRISALEYVEGSPNTLDALVSARKKDAQEDFLRGNSPSYSASFTQPKKVQCSICSKQYKTEKWGSYSWHYPSCDHRKGEKYDGKYCEAFFWGTSFLELSRTPMPADTNATTKGKSFSVEDDEEREGEDDMGVKTDAEKFSEQLSEKDAKIAGLTKELEDQKKANDVLFSDLKKAQESERKFAIMLLQNDRRMDKADEEKPEFKKIFANNDVETAYAIISRFERKTEIPSTLRGNPPTAAPGEEKSPTSEDVGESSMEYLRKRHPDRFPKKG